MENVQVSVLSLLGVSVITQPLEYRCDKQSTFDQQKLKQGQEIGHEIELR